MTLSSNYLKVASIGFAVLWTLAMVVSSGDDSAVSIAFTAIGGAVGGVLWYFGMKAFFTLWLKWTRQV